MFRYQFDPYQRQSAPPAAPYIGQYDPRNPGVMPAMPDPNMFAPTVMPYPGQNAPPPPPNPGVGFQPPMPQQAYGAQQPPMPPQATQRPPMPTQAPMQAQARPPMPPQAYGAQRPPMPPQSMQRPPMPPQRPPMPPQAYGAQRPPMPPQAQRQAPGTQRPGGQGLARDRGTPPLPSNAIDNAMRRAGSPAIGRQMAGRRPAPGGGGVRPLRPTGG
jgi:hypothetical protein